MLRASIAIIVCAAVTLTCAMCAMARSPITTFSDADQQYPSDEGFRNKVESLRLAIEDLSQTFGESIVSLSGKPAQSTSTSCGFTLFYRDGTASQVALMSPAVAAVMSLGTREHAALRIPLSHSPGTYTLAASVTFLEGEDVEIVIEAAGQRQRHTGGAGGRIAMRLSGVRSSESPELRIQVKSAKGRAAVLIGHFSSSEGGVTTPLEFAYESPVIRILPPPPSPELAPHIEQALIEWDWKMQDGIATPRFPVTYAAATENTVNSGELLLGHLESARAITAAETAIWRQLRQDRERLSSIGAGDEEWEALWRRVHTHRRALALRNPLVQTGPLAFVKHVPGVANILMRQYQGRWARPGGGIFVLDNPGTSMQCRGLTGALLPVGSYQHLDVDYEGERLVFAFCRTKSIPDLEVRDTQSFFHLYEIAPNGSGIRQLTDGSYDDFSPRYSPSEDILFVSSRRGGYSRCGPDYSPVNTLARINPDGTDLRLLSFHEINEFDPAVLNDGRLIYTRWDYVDRHAYFYQHLWTTRVDGTNPAIYYGNNTYNPMGTFEARAIPGSNRVMATAGPHHATTAGSIVLVDVTRGLDDLDPIIRLTPNVPFPESEFPLNDAKMSKTAMQEQDVPVAGRRWPGHCYRSAYPLSENFFLAAYSFEGIAYEDQGPNAPNMFGLYLADSFGNKELLYRDLNCSSLWPMPLRPRAKPMQVAETGDGSNEKSGHFIVQNVYKSDPPLPPDVAIKKLRIVQVFPRTSPSQIEPMIGLARAACGRQVLGTVPVEKDGSAFFEAPAGVPLAFQVLDDRGRAVQMMRSLTYLQPGETASCIGCHESRHAAPSTHAGMLALRRAPSRIQNGPNGSKPLSFPLLVQPVLDKHCVSCHNTGVWENFGVEGAVTLEGNPVRRRREGRFTDSYDALVRMVPFSEWVGDKGFRESNCEPRTQPGFFGALGSPLMKMLDEQHGGAELSEEDFECLITWMDTNALFYGTFEPDDMERQFRGEIIEGPGLE